MKDWESFLNSLEEVFGAGNIDRWVRPLRIEKFDAKNLYLRTTDSFQEEWVREHLLPYASEHFRNNNHSKIRIHLNAEKVHEALPALEPEEMRYVSDFLFPWAIFDQFVPSPENDLTIRSLAKIFGLDPGTFEPIFDFNPLVEMSPIFLYGAAATGKTHLLMAIAHLLLQRRKKVVIVDANTFTDHVVAAIRNNEMDKFRKAYRTVDVLMVDNVDKFSKRAATQEELFHTFNALFQASRLLIFTSRSFPRTLQNIEERLISRFEWGLTLKLEKITQPKFLQKMAEKRLRHYNLYLKKSAFDHLVKHFPSPEGLHSTIEALSHSGISKDRFLDLEVVEPFFQEKFSESRRPVVNEEFIIKLIADSFGIGIKEIKAKSQKKETVFPRKIAMYFMRKELRMPYMKIAAVFDKDHSTVMSSIKQVRKLLESGSTDTLFHTTAVEKKLLETK